APRVPSISEAPARFNHAVQCPRHVASCNSGRLERSATDFNRRASFGAQTGKHDALVNFVTDIPARGGMSKNNATSNASLMRFGASSIAVIEIVRSGNAARSLGRS